MPIACSVGLSVCRLFYYKHFQRNQHPCHAFLNHLWIYIYISKAFESLTRFCIASDFLMWMAAAAATRTADTTGLSRIMICFTQSCLDYLTVFHHSFNVHFSADCVLKLESCASAEMWMHLLLLIDSQLSKLKRSFYVFFLTFSIQFNRIFWGMCNASESTSQLPPVSDRWRHFHRSKLVKQQKVNAYSTYESSGNLPFCVMTQNRKKTAKEKWNMRMSEPLCARVCACCIA